MDLKTQIIVLIFSFVYGILFSILVNLSYKLICNFKKVFRILYTFVFVLINSLVYFFVLKLINDAILHYYSLIVIIFGFVIIDIVKKRWYTKIR
ncbi:MAG: hypothetical protein PHU05_01195 [Bacilli bacterium]|nr:hypothetical protein [Bacilli bacterium]